MARSFGKLEPSKYEVQQQLLKEIDCDYKTWKLQWKACHDETENTMCRIIENFGKLLEAYTAKPGSS
jgi:hypothetical protein